MYTTRVSGVSVVYLSSLCIFVAALTCIGYRFTLFNLFSQRTHVTTHAAGLLMQYAFEAQPTGLGLR